MFIRNNTISANEKGATYISEPDYFLFVTKDNIVLAVYIITRCEF